MNIWIIYRRGTHLLLMFCSLVIVQSFWIRTFAVTFYRQVHFCTCAGRDRAATMGRVLTQAGCGIYVYVWVVTSGLKWCRRSRLFFYTICCVAGPARPASPPWRDVTSLLQSHKPAAAVKKTKLSFRVRWKQIDYFSVAEFYICNLNCHKKTANAQQTKKQSSTKKKKHREHIWVLHWEKNIQT